MALQKTKSLDNGTTGDYWKITSIIYNRSASRLAVIITLFLDKSHGIAFKGLNYFKSYSFPITLDDATGNVIQFAYDQIKIAANQAANNPPPMFKDSPDTDLSDAEDV